MVSSTSLQLSFVPQGLKPGNIFAAIGTAEAVPFRSCQAGAKARVVRKPEQWAEAHF